MALWKKSNHRNGHTAIQKTVGLTLVFSFTVRCGHKRMFVQYSIVVSLYSAQANTIFATVLQDAMTVTQSRRRVLFPLTALSALLSPFFLICT